MKLFAIYIGGELEGANIELHDMRFVVAPSIVDTYEELRRQWWGVPKSQVDGYEVELRPEPFSGPKKLYYLNLGGYDAGEFLEKHKNVFMVARSATEVKRRAKTEAKSWNEPHRDQMYEAEQAFSLDGYARERRLYLHLTPSAQVKHLTFTCGFVPIKGGPQNRG